LVNNGKNYKDGNGKKFGSRDEINTNINSHVRNGAVLENGANFEGNTGNGMTSHHSISVEGELVDNGKNNKNGNGKKFGSRDEINTNINSHVRNGAVLESGANFKGNTGNGITSHHSFSVQAENGKEREIKDISDNVGLGKLIEFGHEGEFVDNDRNIMDGNGMKFGSRDKININSHARNDAILEDGVNFEGNTGNEMTSHHTISIQAENVNEHEIKDIFDSFGLGTLTEYGREGELIDNMQIIKDDQGKKFESRDDININSHVRNDAILRSGANFEGNTGDGMTSHHTISIEAENVNEHEIKDIFDSFGLGTLTEYGREGELIVNDQNIKGGLRKKFGSIGEINTNINSHVQNDAIFKNEANLEGNTDHGGVTSHHSFSVEAENVNEHEMEDILDSFGLGTLASKYDIPIGNSDDSGVNLKYRSNDATLESGADFTGNPGHGMTFHHRYSMQTQNDYGHDGDILNSYDFEKHVKYGFEGEPANFGQSDEETRDEIHFAQSDDLGANLDISRNSLVRNVATLENGADIERNAGHGRTFDHSYSAQTQNDDGHDSGSISSTFSHVKSVKFGGDSELGSISLTDKNSHGKTFGLGHRTPLVQSGNHGVDFGIGNHLDIEDDESKGLSNRSRLRIKNGSGNDKGPEMHVKFGRDISMDSGNKVVRKEYMETKSKHSQTWFQNLNKMQLNVKRRLKRPDIVCDKLRKFETSSIMRL
ncbi:spidroin 3A variant 1, partial [Trichonephila clavata]